MSNSRMFTVNGKISSEQIAQAVSSFFQVRKQLQSEVLKTQEGFLVQAKSEDSFKKLVGLGNATQVQIYNENEGKVLINVGEGQWVDKAGAATVGMFIFAPLAVTAAIGAWRQKNLPDEIFTYVNTFIMNDGKMPDMVASEVVEQQQPVSAQTNSSVQTSTATQTCPNCGSTNAMGVKFCSNCGTALQKICPECQTPAAPDAKFCSNCGHRYETADATKGGE